MAKPLLFPILICLFAGHAAAQSLPVVAAENFYGDIARQIAGPGVQVSSILTNPDQDPHLFEASPSVARQLATAAIVICNGADYDPWMTKLLGATHAPDRQVIVVADIMHRKSGDNPHLWYDPPAMPSYAKALATALAQRDPRRKAEYEQRLQSFLTSLQPLQQKISEVRTRFHGTPVTATEPVFGYMATALGLVMHNQRFQLAVMNGTEPRASDIAAIDDDLRKHRVHILFYNSQATDTAARRLVAIAHQSGIPVVGVTETEPPGKTYQQWMADQLDAVAQALANHPS